MQIEPAGPRFKATREAGLSVIEIPARRSWFMMLFVCAWVGGWAFGEMSVAKELMQPTGKSSYGFLLFWFVGWTLGGLLAIATLLWQVGGRELLSVHGGNLVHRIEVLGVGISRAYRTADIRELRLQAASQPGAGGQSHFQLAGVGSGALVFDFGARTVRIGAGLDEAEAKLLLLELELELEMMLPQKKMAEFR